MRIAFSANPLPGHVVPMVPLVRAALRAGHQVAVVTAADAADFVRHEVSPAVEVLPAGLPTTASMAAMQRETGVSPATAPRPDVIAEYFGVRRVRETVTEALRVTRAWRPDVVVAEVLDFVGPHLAADLGVPLLRHGFGPERPAVVRSALAAAERRTAAERGVELPPVAAWVDVYPAFLEDPAAVRTGRRIAVRPAPLTRPGTGERTTFPVEAVRTDPARVLVTMGTVFGDRGVLERIVRSVEHALGAGASSAAAVDGAPSVVLVNTVVGDVVAPPSTVPALVVENVPFRPLADLLVDADVVVTVGGAGTVLGALTAGRPLVAMPMGADHEVNTARAVAVGAAVRVTGPEEVGPALVRVLADDRMTDAARTVAADIAGLPSADEALVEVERVVAAAASSAGTDRAAGRATA